MATKLKKKDSRISIISKNIELARADQMAAASVGVMTKKSVSKIGTSTRQMEQALWDFYMDRLKKNGLFIEAMAKKDARRIYLLANQAAVGVREVGGNNNGPLVELMQQTIGSAGREAWCMADQQSCLEFAEEATGIVSPIHASEHCQTVLVNTPKLYHVKTFPLAGAMIIWQHWKAGKPSQDGHTGCLESTDGKTMYTYEGNTEAGLNNKGEVERDGGGHYHVKRGFTGNGNMKVRGFLIPFPKVAA